MRVKVEDRFRAESNHICPLCSRLCGWRCAGKFRRALALVVTGLMRRRRGLEGMRDLARRRLPRRTSRTLRLDQPRFGHAAHSNSAILSPCYLPDDEGGLIGAAKSGAHASSSRKHARVGQSRIHLSKNVLEKLVRTSQSRDPEKYGWSAPSSKADGQLTVRRCGLSVRGFRRQDLGKQVEQRQAHQRATCPQTQNSRQ